jgi:purine-binding chemotaxis protein CheW
MVATLAENLRLIRCTVGQDIYGLEMDFVRTIVHADSIHWADGEDGAVGEIEEADSTIPVFSLGKMLGRPAINTSHQPAVIVLKADPPRALLVDRVSQVTQVSAQRCGPLASALVGRQASFFQGIVHHEGELLLLLSPGRLSDSSGGEAPWPSSRSNHLPSIADISAVQSPNLGHGQLLLFNPLAPTVLGRPITCGLSVAQVLEILDPPPLTSVPSAPHFVNGVVNWGDHSVPVLDLATCLGLPRAYTQERTRLLVAYVPDSNDLLAFRVSPAIRIIRLPVPHQLSTRNLELNEEIILGAFELRNETMIMLDLAAILDFVKSGSGN